MSLPLFKRISCYRVRRQRIRHGAETGGHQRKKKRTGLAVCLGLRKQPLEGQRVWNDVVFADLPVQEPECVDSPSFTGCQCYGREGYREVAVPAPGWASSPGRNALPFALTPALPKPNCFVKEWTKIEEEKRTYRRG